MADLVIQVSNESRVEVDRSEGPVVGFRNQRAFKPNLRPQAVRDNLNGEIETKGEACNQDGMRDVFGPDVQVKILKFPPLREIEGIEDGL